MCKRCFEEVKAYPFLLQRFTDLVVSIMSFYDNIKIDFIQLPLSEVDVQRLKADKANF
jgi:hypothetical protein